MANRIFANGREISTRSTGKQIAVYPDTCKMPTPGGPVPIPFPNIATNDGARTGVSRKKVKIRKKPGVAGSKLVTSRGDEAGAAAMKGVITSKRTGTLKHGPGAMDVKLEGASLTSPLATGHVVNAAPPVPCGNPACRFHKHPLPATQTARLPSHVQVDFPNRLVCLECYRSLVGGEPLPAGSSIAAPFIPGGAVVSAAMGGAGQLRGAAGA